MLLKCFQGSDPPVSRGTQTQSPAPHVFSDQLLLHHLVTHLRRKFFSHCRRFQNFRKLHSWLCSHHLSLFLLVSDKISNELLHTPALHWRDFAATGCFQLLGWLSTCSLRGGQLSPALLSASVHQFCLLWISRLITDRGDDQDFP